MVLPCSLPLSASQINVELGRAPTATFNMLGVEERELAEVPVGAVSISDFLCKSASEYAYIEHTQSTTINIGAAHADRRVVVIIHWQEGSAHRTLSSASIGGIAATIHIQRGHTGGSTGLGVAIVSAKVPTGTTALLTRSFSGSGVTNVEHAVWRLLRYDTVVDSGSDESQVTTTALSVEVTTENGGAITAGYTGSTNTFADPVTWSNVTEQYDGTEGSGADIRYSGADLATNGTNVIVGATQGTIVNSGNDMCVVSWGK